MPNTAMAYIARGTEIATPHQIVEARRAFNFLNKEFHTAENAWLACGYRCLGRFDGTMEKNKGKIPLRMYRAIMHTYLEHVARIKNNPVGLVMPRDPGPIDHSPKGTSVVPAKNEVTVSRDRIKRWIGELIENENDGVVVKEVVKEMLENL